MSNKDKEMMNMTDGQTPAPAPHLPSRPSAASAQNMFKGQTLPPPPALPQCPVTIAVPKDAANSAPPQASSATSSDKAK